MALSKNKRIEVEDFVWIRMINIKTGGLRAPKNYSKKVAFLVKETNIDVKDAEQIIQMLISKNKTYH